MDTGALADAIRSCRVVEISYRPDQGGGTRIVHPHALYRPGRGGLCLDALQVAGQTRSGQLPAWRQFRLMELDNVRVLNAVFEPAPDFEPEASKYRHGLIAAVPDSSAST